MVLVAICGSAFQFYLFFLLKFSLFSFHLLDIDDFLERIQNLNKKENKNEMKKRQ